MKTQLSMKTTFLSLSIVASRCRALSIRKVCQRCNPSLAYNIHPSNKSSHGNVLLLRNIHLHPLGKTSALGMERSENSVTGPVYQVESGTREDFPVVQLYTKEGCTLCDKVSNVLRSVREECPHSLDAIDITDLDKTEFYDKYKWDIPVLHINGKYWTKHKLDVKEAVDALTRATNGEFEEQRGEPNAAVMEKRMTDRKNNQSY
mmetsp:Transcript_4887/g.9321  ORF Transcript_4887/g.9321 Transcript_4887/m.9321 type:complete len:204 (-) Transcript_4887:1282-1893(-)